MKHQPDISIVLLTWNRRRYLELGLPSLLGALSRNLSHEILVMDNASTDGTMEFLSRFAAHPEIRVIHNDTNLRFKGYNRLFAMAKGKLIIEIDDDVIEFPPNFDETFVNYYRAFPDYGYLALDTIRNDKTDGNRGTFKFVDERNGMVVEEGESRGYCAAFRRRDYRLIQPFTWFFRFTLDHPQDWVISGLVRRVLGKRNGVIRGVKCLHAYGPQYSKEFGREDSDREKFCHWGKAMPTAS